MIVDNGFSLTGQMMIGLPGATVESEIETATQICALGAKSARIYPTVVFYNTELCNMAIQGQYTPLTNEQAVERAAKVYKVFCENGVKLLRIGLQSGEGLQDENVYGGASHSAIGEMTVSRYYLDLMREICRKMLTDGKLKSGDSAVLTVFCAEGETSKVSGQKRVNKEKICELFKKQGVNIINIKVKEAKDTEKNRVRITEEIIRSEVNGSCT